MLGLQMRRAFHRHRAADVDVRRLDLALGEADRGKQVEIRRRNRFRLELQGVAQEVLAKGPLVEGELDVEGGRQRRLDLRQSFVGEALGLQGGNVDGGRVGERAVADGIGLDLRDVAFTIAERAQRLRARRG